MLCTLLASQAIEIFAIKLECTYVDSTKWGKFCSLSKKESIPMSSKNNKYEYSGNATDKSDVKDVVFRTSKVSFVPKETFTEFPNLKSISFTEANLTTLTYDWLHSITSSFTPNITEFYLSFNSIEAIEPRAIEIFEKFDIVYLTSDNCTSKDFYKSSGDFVTMEGDLNDCFENFVKNSTYKYVLNSLKRIDEKIEENLLKRIDEKNEEDLLNTSEDALKNDEIKKIFIYFSIALIMVLVLMISLLTIGCFFFWKLLAKETKN